MAEHSGSNSSEVNQQANSDIEKTTLIPQEIISIKELFRFDIIDMLNALWI